MALFGFFGKKNKKKPDKPFEEETGFLDAFGEEESSRSYLLVVGNGKVFSKYLIEYSVEMAKRLNYSIMALNAAPIGEELPVKSMERRKLMEEFEKECRESASVFKKRAEEEGIDFIHVIKFMEKDTALDEMKREYPEIEFVISDSEKDYITEEEENSRSRVCVYSVA